MPRVAIAVPEADAQAIHDELLKDDPSETFTSTPYACRRCGAVFAIFFMNSHDQNNPTMLTNSEKRSRTTVNMADIR